MSDGVVLVTGGSRGIGREVVRSLAAHGWSVAFTFRQDETSARELEAELNAAQAFVLDLADTSRPASLVREIEAGMGPIVGLVSNAGERAESLLAMTSDAQWERTLDTTLGGAFRLCRAVLPQMVTRRQGSIVLVSSLAATRGVAGLSTYSAAKAGLLGMTRSLAREVGGRSIRVNSVLPGFVQTDSTALLGNDKVQQLRASECLPEGVSVGHVAEVVRFLLSPESSAITGQAIHVDAGASA